MKNRLIERAEIEVSEVGFGCMSLGNDSKLNQRLIHKAIDHGISYFDTADLYQKGENERMLGMAIREKRDQVVIATKVGNRWNDDGSTWSWVPRKSYILQAADKSLERLGVEQIDLYQLHGGTLDDPFDEVIEAFEILQAQGKIKAFGISSIRPNVFRRLASTTKVSSNMMQFSILDRRPEPYLDDLANKGIGVMARGVLAKGLLVNKSISKYLNYSIEDIELQINKLKTFSIEKMSLLHLAIAWVLKHRAISSAVIGIRNMEQLDDVLAYIDVSDLLEKNIEQLPLVLSPNRYQNHLN